MNRRNLLAGIATLPLLALPGGEQASAEETTNVLWELLHNGDVMELTLVKRDFTVSEMESFIFDLQRCVDVHKWITGQARQGRYSFLKDA